jgi:hypothetical protein
MTKYSVGKHRFQPDSTHDTLAAAGRAALKHNESNRHPGGTLVGVYHPTHGDVTGPAFLAATAKPEARLPRRLQARKHARGADEIEKMLRPKKRRSR